VIEPFPEGIIHAVEEALGIWIPGPPQVVGQFAQAGDAARQIKMVWDASVKIGHIYPHAKGNRGYHTTTSQRVSDSAIL
jgi:hypothetical protein